MGQQAEQQPGGRGAVRAGADERQGGRRGGAADGGVPALQVRRETGGGGAAAAADGAGDGGGGTGEQTEAGEQRDEEIRVERKARFVYPAAQGLFSY